jgi:hypothetical protein
MVADNLLYVVNQEWRLKLTLLARSLRDTGPSRRAPAKTQQRRLTPRGPRPLGA